MGKFVIKFFLVLKTEYKRNLNLEENEKYFFILLTKNQQRNNCVQELDF